MVLKKLFNVIPNIMNFKILILLATILLSVPTVNSASLESQTITLKSNERFELVQANTVTFKFQPLSEDARKLEITNDATALGVAYLGQVKLRENSTPLSALRSIADQIGESLDISFGVIADSNTSEALKTNELLLLYHPQVTITLALVKPNEANDYEIICTYALRNAPETTSVNSSITTTTEPQQESTEEITTAEDIPEVIDN